MAEVLVAAVKPKKQDLGAALDAFLVTRGRRGGVKCQVCSQPTEIRAFIEESVRRGVAYSDVGDFLRKTESLKVSDAAIGNHNRKHVSVE
jgi:hypothetical protein